jgi:nitroreductase
MHRALSTLIDAAILAPSGDNTQPWLFLVDENELAIEIQVDPSRDRSPMNAGQRMAWIACGAAAENMLLTAAENRWESVIRPMQKEGAHCQQLRVLPSVEPTAGIIPACISQRITNRQMFDRQPIAADRIDALTAKMIGARGLDVHWLLERRDIEKCGRFIGEADGVMFRMDAMRRAFLDQVRFDQSADAATEEGLPVETVAHGYKDRIAIKALRSIPQWAFRAFGVKSAFRRRAIELVESASGICVITAKDDLPETDFEVGRVFEHVWLVLTELGLAVQPMMSLPVLDSWARFEGLDQREVRRLVSESTESIVGRQRGRIAAILRFGHATAPRCRTGRRPASAVCRFHDHREPTVVEAAN